MSVLQFVQPNSSINGYGRRKIEREGESRVDNKLNSNKSGIGKLANTNYSSGNKIGGSQDRLVYFSTYLIGLDILKKLRLKIDRFTQNFSCCKCCIRGIVLKMACLTAHMRCVYPAIEDSTRFPKQGFLQYLDSSCQRTCSNCGQGNVVKAKSALKVLCLENALSEKHKKGARFAKPIRK